MDLSSLTRQPIAALNPSVESEDAYVEGIITLVWPYSASKRTMSVLIAEPDFRLRQSRGQVRVTFEGASARDVARSGLNSGDHLFLRLLGAEWKPESAATETPGRGIDWELRFRRRLDTKFRRDGKDPIAIVVDQKGSPPIPDAQSSSTTTSSPIVRTPIEQTFPEPASRKSWQSPAFLKRKDYEWLSTYDPVTDSLADNGEVDSERPAKRIKYSRPSREWKFASRSPSPEKEVDEALTLHTNLNKGIDTPKSGDYAEQPTLTGTPNGDAMVQNRPVLGHSTAGEAIAGQTAEEPATKTLSILEKDGGNGPLLPTRASTQEVSVEHVLENLAYVTESEDVMPQSPILQPLPSSDLPVISPILERGDRTFQAFVDAERVDKDLNSHLKQNSIRDNQEYPSHIDFPPQSKVEGVLAIEAYDSEAQKHTAQETTQSITTDQFRESQPIHTDSSLNSDPNPFMNPFLSNLGHNEHRELEEPSMDLSMDVSSQEHSMKQAQLDVAKGTDVHISEGRRQESEAAVDRSIVPHQESDPPGFNEIIQSSADFPLLSSLSDLPAGVVEQAIEISRHEHNCDSTIKDQTNIIAILESESGEDSDTHIIEEKEEGHEKYDLDDESLLAKDHVIESTDEDDEKSDVANKYLGIEEKGAIQDGLFVSDVPSDESSSESVEGLKNARQEEAQSTQVGREVAIETREDFEDTNTSENVLLEHAIEAENLDGEPLPRDGHARSTTKASWIDGEVESAKILTPEPSQDIHQETNIREQTARGHLITPEATQQNFSNLLNPSLRPSITDQDLQPNEPQENELRASQANLPNPSEREKLAEDGYFEQMALREVISERNDDQEAEIIEGPVRIEESVDDLTTRQTKNHDEPTSASLEPRNLVIEGLRTRYSNFILLKDLHQQFPHEVDVFGIVLGHRKPERAEKGRRDYHLTLYMSDASNFDKENFFTMAQIFRPYKNALPTLHYGSAVLLRNFKVQLFKKTSYSLLSTDTSSWAVFAKGKEVQVRGPPIEYGVEEEQYVEVLMNWWASVDEERKKRAESSIEKLKGEQAEKQKEPMANNTQGETRHELRNGRTYVDRRTAPRSGKGHELRDGTVYGR